ncbi:cob(I)yrinic acid a,c-diamide adenosyltransferase [Alicyclobacillus tolerans]|uniref:Corrinoid adenosyltransferase n=1 Tax=Alicyclobacillus tolerans TaxID=90970 RepID=A0A1M6JR45_9BACL|nr:cob(I)yrinic acid a,c-diamide adenosyltransferase [Alicyclobacillus montanus]SHJ49235.1 cob(I)alamin adenosyltransferase [Alicyclobacillus montanus]
MRIYTRGGDLGKTALIGGERRFKDDVRIEAYGSVDELGANLAFAESLLDSHLFSDIKSLIAEIQQRLWDVGADLAAPESAKDYQFRTPDGAAAELEPSIDKYQQEADKLSKFVIRGGTTEASAMHVACTVARRAERRIVALMHVEEIHPPTLRYVNRLSDLLFVLARAINVRLGENDVQYKNSKIVFREPNSRGKISNNEKESQNQGLQEDERS